MHLLEHANLDFSFCKQSGVAVTLLYVSKTATYNTWVTAEIGERNCQIVHEIGITVCY